MKGKKAVLIVCFLCITLFLCAFAVLPSVNLQSSRNDAVRLSYVDADLDTDILTLYVDYESYGKFFEIAEDITVATDKDFTNKLVKTSSTAEESKYTYSFSLNEPVETIYISPPTLYITTEIATTSLALRSGKDIVMLDEQNWFSISSVTTKKIKEGMFAVIVSIDRRSVV